MENSNIWCLHRTPSKTDEYGQEVGTRPLEDRVKECFEKDLTQQP